MTPFVSPNSEVARVIRWNFDHHGSAVDMDKLGEMGARVEMEGSKWLIVSGKS
jgi:hypothetical protein